RLAQADPKDARAQRDLSVSYIKLGDVTLRLGQAREALGLYQKALEVSQRLAQADPRDAQAQPDPVIRYWKLGRTEKAQHDYAKAGVWFAKARAALLPWHEKKLLVGQFKNAVGDMKREIALCQNAQKAIDRLAFVFEQPPAVIPGLLD